MSGPDPPDLSPISNRKPSRGRLRHHAQNLINTPGLDDIPSWSPDGRPIAFGTSWDGDREIYVMNADSSEPINMSNTRLMDEFSSAWRPQARFKGT
jgi:Tol biopolymer transport system component